MAESPLVLQITAEDLASAVLSKVAAEVHKLAPAATQTSSGLNTLTGATQKTTDSAGKLGQAVTHASTSLQGVTTVSKATTDAFAAMGLKVDASGKVFNAAGAQIQVLSGEIVQQTASSAKAVSALGGLSAATQALGNTTQIGAARVTGLDNTIKQAEISFRQLNPSIKGNANSLDDLLGRFPRLSSNALDAGKALGQTGSQAGQASNFLKETGRASDQLSNSLGSILKTTALATVGFATIGGALSLVSRGVSSAVTSLGDFEAALNNAYTNGVRSIAVQEQLRAQILQLSPVLGSATDLAKGLYEVLSSGIEPAKSVAFLEQSARLAKAGLSDLDSSTLALTKTMAAYRIPTEQAAEVSEILFKTVVLGQGHLKEFAKAFPTVTQFSSELGLSLKDTAATLATLSIVFKSPEQASTGFKTFLADITQNLGKFRDVGIDVKAVIAEGGIAGLMRELTAVTHGSAEALHQFIPDVRGAQAALALMGPEFQKLIDIQGKYQKDTDEVGTAIKLQARGMQESWTAYGNALDRVRQAQGKPFTEFAASLANTLTETVEKNRAAASSTVTWRDALDALTGVAFHNKEVTEQQNALLAIAAPLRQAEIKDAYGYRAAVKAQSDDVAFLNQAKKIAHELTQQESEDIAQVEASLKSFHEEAGKKGVHLINAAQLEEDATKGAESLQRLAGLGKVSFEKIALDAHVLHDNILTSLGTLPEEAGDIFEQLFAREHADLDLATKSNIRVVTDGLKTIQDASKGLTIIDVAKLTTETTATKAALLSLADGGKVPFAAILADGQKLVEGLRKLLGPGNPIVTSAQEGLDQLVAKFRTSAEAIPAAFKAAGVQTREELQKTATESAQTFRTLLETVQQSSTGTVELVKDASGKILLQNKVTVDGIGQQMGAGLTATMQGVLKTLETFIDDFNASEAKKLPEGFQAALAQFTPTLKKLGLEVTLTKDTLGNLRIELEETGKSTTSLGSKTDDLGQAFAKTGQEAEAYAKNLRIAQERARDVSVETEKATDATNKYGNALAITSMETDKLNKLRISVKEDFADDVPGLLAQLQRARQEASRIAGQGEPAGSTGFKEFTLDALAKTIDAIKAKLKDLGVDIAAVTANPFDQLTAGAKDAVTAVSQLADAAANPFQGFGKIPNARFDAVLQADQGGTDTDTTRAASLESDRRFSDARRALQSEETQRTAVVQAESLKIDRDFTAAQKALQVESLTSGRTFADQKKRLAEDSAKAARDFADQLKALDTNTGDFAAQKQALDAKALASSRKFADDKRTLDEASVKSTRDFTDRIAALSKDDEDYAQQKQQLQADALASSRDFADQKRALDEASVEAPRVFADQQRQLTEDQKTADIAAAATKMKLQAESIESARTFTDQKVALDEASIEAARAFTDELQSQAAKHTALVAANYDTNLTLSRDYAADLAAIDQQILANKRKFQDELRAIQAQPAPSGSGTGAPLGGSASVSGTPPGGALDPVTGRPFAPGLGSQPFTPQAPDYADRKPDLGVADSQVTGAKKLLAIFNETGNQEIRKYLNALQEGFADNADQIAYNTDKLQQAGTTFEAFHNAAGESVGQLKRQGEVVLKYTLSLRQLVDMVQELSPALQKQQRILAESILGQQEQLRDAPGDPALTGSIQATQALLALKRPIDLGPRDLPGPTRTGAVGFAPRPVPPVGPAPTAAPNEGSKVGSMGIDPLTGRPYVPGLGSLAPGRGTTGPVNPVPALQPLPPSFIPQSPLFAPPRPLGPPAPAPTRPAISQPPLEVGARVTGPEIQAVGALPPGFGRNPRAADGAPVTTIHGGVTVVMPQALDRMSAQTFATQLLPAIEEALRRKGGGTR